MLTIEKKSLKVGKFVNTEHVDTVIRTYKQERWAPNSERLGKEDSLSAWLSIEEMEEFIAKAKDHGGDGIRVYFACYPKDYQDQPLYAGRQTIVMVGTKYKRDEQGLTAHKDIYLSNTDGESDILAYNSYSLCPPYCKPKGSEDVGITIIDKGDNGLAIV